MKFEFSNDGVQSFHDSESPLIKYDLKPLPVTIEHKLVDKKDRHEELLHWQDEVEIIRIRQGTIHCHVNDSDFLLNPGELCFINYEQLHRVYNTSPVACDMDVLTVKTSILSHSALIYEKYVKPVISNRDFAHVQIDGRNSYAMLISEIFTELFALAADRPAGYELDVIAYIHMLFRRLYLVYSDQKETFSSVPMDLTLQRKMSDFIYENYKKRITLDDIAASAGVNRSKCNALFRKYTQKTPIAFLGSYRLEMGSRLLAQTDENVAYVAQACGFSDQSYFNRQFLREYGCTPMEYRKMHR